MPQSHRPAGSLRSAAAPLQAAPMPSNGAGPFMTTRLVHSLSKLGIGIVEGDPLGLAIRVEGEVMSLGWSGFRLDRRIYLRPPLDGVYEADLVGCRPGGGVPDVRTPFVFETVWQGFPADRLLKLRVRTATNSLEARLF